jgi:hypothetical protein
MHNSPKYPDCAAAKTGTGEASAKEATHLRMPSPGVQSPGGGPIRSAAPDPAKKQPHGADQNDPCAPPGNPARDAAARRRFHWPASKLFQIGIGPGECPQLRQTASAGARQTRAGPFPALTERGRRSQKLSDSKTITPARADRLELDGERLLH